MDKISREQRSRNMAAIRSRGNRTTEAELASLLRKNRITGWRMHQKGICGSPDFLFAKTKLAVFADGCFWHGCGKHCIMPKSNKDYWRKKIARNKTRDRAVNALLRKKGWKIIRIWEHDLKKHPTKATEKIRILTQGHALLK